MDVIITVLILLEVIIVLAWMDMNWNQIITLVQVMNAHILYIHTPVYPYVPTYVESILSILSI